MQKISSYLYSNKVDINLDLASSPTEWRIVYQRKVKIYKGYDNIIELDIKNSQQKRFDVSDLTIKCLIMDSLGQEVYTADVVHSSTPGLATFTIPAADIDYLSPQFLRYAVYVLNEDDTKNVIYGDTQFGVTGMMDLIGSAQVLSIPAKVIKTFTVLHSTTEEIKTYYSESVDINPPNDIAATSDIEVEFKTLNLSAEVKVQITYDKVVHTATNWQTIETFNIANNTNTVTKTYTLPDDFTDEVNWLRITYIEATGNTGKFDRVIVRQ
jgi:hypothetical protein